MIMWNRGILTVTVLLASGVLANSKVHAEGPTPRDKSISLLLLESASRFGARAGRGSSLTQEARAFVSLTKIEGGADQFASLTESRNPAARLYGLCGLFRLRDARFGPASRLVAASSDEVATIDGCIASTIPVSKAMEGVADGKASSIFLSICRSFPPPKGHRRR